MLKIPNSSVELGIHVTFKTVQAGTLIGTVVGGIVGVLRKPGLTSGAIRGGKIGLLVGLVAGPSMTALKIQKSQLNEIQLYDRCYRLRMNVRQLNIDRFTMIGAGLGLGFGGPAGMILGIDAGILAGNLYNQVAK